jgi:hypothetical protein
MPWQSVGSPFVVISPVAGIILIYNGTPALGNLAASFIASQVPFPSIAGTDQYGNNYLGGETWYNNSFPYSYVNINQGITTYGFMSGAQPATFPTTTFTAVNAATWSPFGTGLQVGNFIDINGPASNAQDNLIMNSANGPLTYYSEADQAVYDVGKQWAFTSGVTLTSTSPAVIFGVNVDNPIVYHYKVFLCIESLAAAGTYSFGFDGSASCSGVGSSSIGFSGSAPNANINSNSMPALATSLAMTGSGQLGYYMAEGQFSVSTSGVLNVRGQLSAAADHALVVNGSWMYVEPMN